MRDVGTVHEARAARQFIWPERERRGADTTPPEYRRQQAKTFFDDSIEKGQVVELIPRWNTTAAFVLEFAGDLTKRARVLREQKQRPRQGARGRGVAGHEQKIRLADQFVVVQPADVVVVNLHKLRQHVVTAHSFRPPAIDQQPDRSFQLLGR
jgi:hypothetical protein